MTKWKVDHEKSVLLSNFERRGWERSWENDWNVYWASPYSVKQIFLPENGIRLQENQFVNHFPNHYELTRKDLMVKNLKRYRKELERVQAERVAEVSGEPRGDQPPPRGCGTSGGGAPSQGGVTHELDFECIPTTFILPADYALLSEEFRKSPASIWIMKPTAKSKGIGIFIVNKLSQIRRWAASRNGKDAYVCSRYIADPLLIGGKKFDLRIYVLVLSYRPLKVYVNRKGFARFCAYNYTNEVGELDNELVHLTNVAIQKLDADYQHQAHGFKWSLANLLHFIEGTRGLEAAEQLMESMGWLIVHSLKACQNVMIHDKHCFECYGYDIMIDQQLKPWLLEVNASPSLSTTTPADRLLKTQLISEVLDLAIPAHLHEGGKEKDRGEGTPSRSCSRQQQTAAPAAPAANAAPAAPAAGGLETPRGDFELLYDEGAELEAEKAERARREAELARRARNKLGAAAARARGSS